MGRRLLFAALLATLAQLALPGLATAAVGDVQTFPVTEAVPESDLTGPDGNLWFANDADSSAGLTKVSFDGKVLWHFSLPCSTCDYPRTPVDGPDGAIWFTEQGTAQFQDYIGRLTTAGSYQHWPIANSISGVQDMVVGPDGALWATDNITNVGPQLVRTTVDGTMTTYPGVAGKFYTDIASWGGQLWVLAGDGTAPSTSEAESFTTGGVMTHRFPLGTSSGEGLTLGPDDNLWSYDRDQVVKMTATGTVTRYSRPNMQPHGLWRGPDGKLWSWSYSTRQLYSITTTGVFTAYSVPAQVNGATAGPDDNLWITLCCQSQAAVARLTLVEPPPPPSPQPGPANSPSPAPELHTVRTIASPTPAVTPTPMPTPSPLGGISSMSTRQRGSRTYSVTAHFVSATGRGVPDLSVDFAGTRRSSARVPPTSPSWPGIQDAEAVDCHVSLSPSVLETDPSGFADTSVELPANCPGTYVVTATAGGLVLSSQLVEAGPPARTPPLALLLAVPVAILAVGAAALLEVRRQRRRKPEDPVT